MSDCLHSWRYINKNNRFCVKCHVGAECLEQGTEPVGPNSIGEPSLWRSYPVDGMRRADVVEFVDE